MPIGRKDYVYVDGECMYAMAQKLWNKIHGPDASLSSIARNPMRPGLGSQPGISVYPDAKFFWDSELESGGSMVSHMIDRKVYFTTFTGVEGDWHTARVRIRAAGFEPQVIKELKDLKQQRANQLEQDGVLIKGKGADIGLAVRILEDAYQDNYDNCLLATSDIDFLPVIDVIRRMGKTVSVLAFANGIAKESPFYHVPERLILIDEAFMRTAYVLKPLEHRAS